MHWYGSRTEEEKDTSRYRAHLSVGLEGRWKEEGRLVRTMGVPFELVGQITGSRAMAEASDVESCTTSSRHDEALRMFLLSTDDVG